jgi:hypothetical protein
MGFDPFGAAEEQEADQARNGGLERYQLAPTSCDTEKNQREDQVKDGNIHSYELEVDVAVTEKDNLVDAYVTGWELGVDPEELEISAETVHTVADSALCSSIPGSVATTEDTIPSTDDSPTVQNAEKLTNNDVQSTLASNDTPSEEEWFCQFPSCGESFTHRHKLKYV